VPTLLTSRRVSWPAAQSWSKDFTNPAVIVWAAVWAIIVHLIAGKKGVLLSVLSVFAASMFSAVFFYLPMIAAGIGMRLFGRGSSFHRIGWKMILFAFRASIYEALAIEPHQLDDLVRIENIMYRLVSAILGEYASRSVPDLIVRLSRIYSE